MDWQDSAQEAAFRAEVRGFIESELPERYRKEATRNRIVRRIWQKDRLAEEPERREVARGWAAALAARGWFAPHWPREYGGAGLGPAEQFVFNEEMARADAPSVQGVAVGFLGSALIIHGTDEQKRTHLPRILDGSVVWAQGFSEPGAGSDLAGLSTRAVRDGDEYVVNGQKIWTSDGHEAEWLCVLARTDPELPRHRGISFLLADMRQPGITVRPLTNMNWRHAFNETFFEDARVPLGNRVGEENRGWYVAMTVLDFERSNIAGAVEARRLLSRLIADAIGAGAHRARLDQRDSLRQQIAQRWVEAEVLYGFSAQIISIQKAGGVPNHEASVSKVFGSELAQAIARTGASAYGLYSTLWDADDPRAPLEAFFAQAYVESTSRTIASGTSEIQRNVIATRGLGLPRG
ncbi:MAG: acyl-CoA dehydrogenase family protein [Chloroflexi bacterium]|nr:acyl-CoA dehydrogenase family protein [Chloroflexota bacterium]